jgi:hypothetical protein
MPAPAVPPREADQPPPSQPAPKFAVRTMFGLRAFGRGRPAPDGSNAPQTSQKSEGALLGLRGFSPPIADARQASVERPPMLSPTLPPLPGAPNPMPPTGPGRNRSTEMSEVLQRLGGERGPAPRKTGSTSKSGRARMRGRSAQPRNIWWLGLAGAGVLGVVTVIVVVLATRPSRIVSDRSSPGTSASGPAVASAVNPVASSTTGRGTAARDDQLRGLLEKAHAQGSRESDELRALVDHQAAMQDALLKTGKCDGSAAACSALFKTSSEVDGRKVVIKKRPSKSSGGLPSRWLAGLKMPENFPIEDDLRVQRVFEKYTDTPKGRAEIESMLFRCGAYRDRIQETLIRYELPPSLLAVVFAESGCNPLAKSPVGAEGLWQFMPEAGRHYHLHIVEDVVDERHSPPKSTQAAIQFLADLYKKFNSWDLAFAAYNMGPYGLAARMSRVSSEQVGFWELLDSDLLPQETSQYVPIIEAFALILENLQRLKFAETQMRSPEVTDDLNANPGTRLSLVARAASTSVNQLRLLNLDVKGDTVPSLPGQLFPMQVPKEVVWQAREKLQALTASGSYEDQCVPPTFDWGKQRYTADMDADCKSRMTGAPAAARTQSSAH